MQNPGKSPPSARRPLQQVYSCEERSFDLEIRDGNFHHESSTAIVGGARKNALVET